MRLKGQGRGGLRGLGFVGALAVLQFSASACATQGDAKHPERSEQRSAIVIGEDAVKGGAPVFVTWVAYAAAKEELYARVGVPAANESADDFELELGAREAQSKFWQAQREEGEKANVEFDRQVAIWKAGFLKELVVAVYARPGWTIPGPVLTSLRLKTFLARFPGKYKSRPGMLVKGKSGKTEPDVPGADFPDPAGVSINSSSCELKQEERRAAWERWEALEPKLGGVPLAAGSPADFWHALESARKEREHRTRGVTWVSPLVSFWAHLEGFCAIEAADWPRAERMLRRAVTMAPGDPGVRIEYATTLNGLKRNREALRAVDRALEQIDDGCIAALAWRRRGYFLFDLGALTEARKAYTKSLEIEPGNTIATTEIKTIDDALGASGGREPPADFVPPPPAGPMTVTNCEVTR